MPGSDLWGAALGLLFGSSGILLNHRNEMKIPLASQQETRQISAPPAASVESAEALEAWLRAKFKLPDAKSRIQKKPAGPVPWGGGQIDAAGKLARHAHNAQSQPYCGVLAG